MATKVENPAVPKLLSESSHSSPAPTETAKKRKSPPAPTSQTTVKRSKTESEEPRTWEDEVEDEDDSEEESFEDLARQYKKFINAPKFDLNSEELFCVCRKPDTGELMISCDGCEEWFHFKCMNLKKENSNLIAKFYCKFCTWKGTGSTLWKRKCRVSSCNDPARADSNSKYCSDEHGKLFMRQILIERQKNVNDLSEGMLNDILEYSKSDYSKLRSLGSEFPELPEVVQFKETGKNIEDFPQDVRDDLTKINTKLNSVDKSTEENKYRTEYLSEMKDKIKALNEKLTQSLHPHGSTVKETTKKSKKSQKSKKVDICLYDKVLAAHDTDTKSLLDDLNSSEDLYEDFKGLLEKKLNDELDDDQVWYKDKVCIQDRRKCVRHNGWFNLLFDEVSKKLVELNVLKDKLESQKDTILRNYSTRVYESK
ncbi:uncharacterized protein RJT20DRAFT_128130 [Scheffersomyces xylosifermentans]|uniref:uncharacterized protein n=1 Tax=Scheffersomyces xylosifermentans TaxID=1304137 RepID=UPI00315DCBFC